MTAKTIRLLLFAALFGLAAFPPPPVSVPVRAVEPGEMLSDPALEARARALSREIRCPVCRNESIDDSNADLAGDLRLIVRERLAAGDSDAEVKRYLVDRYGEFVLLKPAFGPANLALWLAGPVFLVLGVALVAVWLRGRRGTGAAQTPLTPEEKAELERLMRD